MKSNTKLAAICLTTVLAMGAAGADYICAQSSSGDSDSSNGGYTQAAATPTIDRSTMSYDPDVTPTAVIMAQKTPGVGWTYTPVVSPAQTPTDEE